MRSRPTYEQIKRAYLTEEPRVKVAVDTYFFEHLLKEAAEMSENIKVAQGFGGASTSFKPGNHIGSTLTNTAGGGLAGAGAAISGFGKAIGSGISTMGKNFAQAGKGTQKDFNFMNPKSNMVNWNSGVSKMQGRPSYQPPAPEAFQPTNSFSSRAEASTANSTTAVPSPVRPSAPVTPRSAPASSNLASQFSQQPMPPKIESSRMQAPTYNTEVGFQGKVTTPQTQPTQPTSAAKPITEQPANNPSTQPAVDTQNEYAAAERDYLQRKSQNDAAEAADNAADWRARGKEDEQASLAEQAKQEQAAALTKERASFNGGQSLSSGLSQEEQDAIMRSPAGGRNGGGRGQMIGADGSAYLENKQTGEMQYAGQNEQVARQARVDAAKSSGKFEGIREKYNKENVGKTVMDEAGQITNQLTS